MKFRKSLAIICLIVCIFCVSGAWAGDADGNLTASDLNDGAADTGLDTQLVAFDDNQKDDELSSNASEELSSDRTSDVVSSNPKTFADLNDAIQNSTGNDIYLNSSYSFNNDSDYSFKNGIVIDREGVTIHGNGHTLDGNCLARIFDIHADVVLKDIVFINGNATYGGAVYGGSQFFSVVNCTFANNYANLFGGAVYSYSQVFSVVNCTFANNSARTFGGAVYGGSQGFSVVNCSFTNNSVRAYGGAVYGGCSVEGCIFENNYAESYGGAIYASGSSEEGNSFSHSSFIKNHAGLDGGAVYCQYKNSFIDCKFIENTAKQYAGAIEIQWANSSFENCSFRKNSAYGWALDIYGNSSFSGCSFRNNSGGLIFSTGNTFIVNSNFDHNYNHNDIRSISFWGVGVKNTIKSCNFTSNVVDSDFILSLKGRGFSAIDCIFKNNKGDLMVNPDSVVNCSFTGNRVNVNGIYNASSVKDCSFIGNVKRILIYQARSCVNCIFKDNSAECVWYVNLCKDCNFTANSQRAVNSAARVKNCRFVNNTNGALSVSKSCEDCVFINNRANSGGAIIGKGASIVNCIFTGNSVGGDGGAIYGDCSVEGCSFNNNYARQGGGAIWGKASKTVKNCNFTNNRAGYGGAVKNSYCINCIFTKNSAASTGGALLDAKAKKCTFIRNSAIYGGAMYKGSFMDCTFISNWASYGFDTCDTYSSEYPYKLMCIKKVVTFYRIEKSFVVTLKNKDGKPLSGVRLKLSRPFAETFFSTTDKKGQVRYHFGRCPITDIVLHHTVIPKNYHYNSKIKVQLRFVVKKASPKFTAASKTFNVNDKIKKYVVTLKYAKNRPIKTTISLKVDGKTYIAKTNSKGQAVFYLKDLNKKGSFKAALTYAGSSCFNKAYRATVIRVT